MKIPLRTTLWMIIVLSSVCLDQECFAAAPQISLTENKAPSNLIPDSVNIPSKTPQEINFLSAYEFWLTISAFIFGIIVLMLQFFSIKHLENIEPDDMLRVFSVTLILVGAIVFVTAGFDSEQIAPAIGLLGTVVGYLLGKREPQKPQSTRNES